eukprot:TRINITY_DN5446_c0_g1_i1.p3 TRINITY_DN5446_c0_g1~~TRINITY_DN5446_c0_g1_i1.p3  ORF type:complete len:127 (-),score=24.72 TRINITY_DN5446_c0_g1_i1:71-451(-)
MLKTKALQDVLRQAHVHGITRSLLMTGEGDLLGAASDDPDSDKYVAAIAANMWRSYEKGGKRTLNAESLQCLLVENEMGRLAVARTARVLVCLVATKSVPLGMLRAKLNAVTTYLEEPMKLLSTTT